MNPEIDLKEIAALINLSAENQKAFCLVIATMNTPINYGQPVHELIKSADKIHQFLTTDGRPQ